MPEETDRLDQEMIGTELATITNSKIGAPGRTRTCGPLLRRQMLYPLSYGSFAFRFRRILARAWHKSNSAAKRKRLSDTLRQPCSLSETLNANYAARVISAASAYTRRPLRASSIISRTAEISGFTSIRSHAA